MTILHSEIHMIIAVIGAGNGGQAIAGHMAAIGHEVRLYARRQEQVDDLNMKSEIRLTGKLNGLVGKLALVTNNMADVIIGADIIMVATTASAHKVLAQIMAPYLTNGQHIVLNPGRTCGALEFKNTLIENGCNKRLYIAEAQTLVYACRIMMTGEVNIIGIKDRVLISALPASDTEAVIKKLKPMYTCFYPAKNILQTSFENIGAMFHPSVVLFNEATIERGHQFYFYREMTPALANFIETLDKERLAVAKAYDIDIISAKDWVSYAYEGVRGNSLCERMQNNPAYYEILAPTTINCRQITEDIPTGIMPMSALGKVVGIETPVMDALITMCSTLLKHNFRIDGRTLESLGLEGLSVKGILDKIH